MADDRIRLQVITQGGVKLDKMVSYVNIPLEGGSIGVLADHAPTLAAVTDGSVKCTTDAGEDEFVYVGTGVAQIMKNGVILLVRAAECAENIDLARAKAAESRAEERLNSKAADIDMIRAEAALRRAMAREHTYNAWRSDD